MNSITIIAEGSAVKLMIEAGVRGIHMTKVEQNGMFCHGTANILFLAEALAWMREPRVPNAIIIRDCRIATKKETPNA